MQIKLPENFSIPVNLKVALCNGFAAITALLLLQVNDHRVLGAAFAYGVLGGSVTDILNFKRNKDAINAHVKKKQGEE